MKIYNIFLINNIKYLCKNNFFANVLVTNKQVLLTKIINNFLYVKIYLVVYIKKTNFYF